MKHIWTKNGRFTPENGSKWTVLGSKVQKRQKPPKWAKNGQKWPKMDHFWSKWKQPQNGQKWTKMDQKWVKINDFQKVTKKHQKVTKTMFLSFFFQTPKN